MPFFNLFMERPLYFAVLNHVGVTYECDRQMDILACS